MTCNFHLNQLQLGIFTHVLTSIFQNLPLGIQITLKQESQLIDVEVPIKDKKIICS